MRARTVLVASLVTGFGGAVFACVDLFHDTDFVTLCTRDPAACGAEASVDSGNEPDAPLPPVDLCASSSVEARKRAVRTCAWLGACEGPAGDSVFGPCMMQALAAFDCSANPGLRPAQPIARIWDCIAKATTCAAVDECVFPGGSMPACGGTTVTFAACVPGTGPAARIVCARDDESRPVAVEICALAGQICDGAEGGVPQCTGKRGTPCTPKSACEGTSAVLCGSVDRVDDGHDCAGFGDGRCVEGDGGVACAPVDDAPACSKGGSVTCDGGIASVCVDGRSVSVDCKKMGLPCDVSTAPVTALDPLAACSNRAEGGTCGPDVCDQNTLRSCSNGTPFEVDCASVGLGPCRKLERHATLALCGPPL